MKNEKANSNVNTRNLPLATDRERLETRPRLASWLLALGLLLAGLGGAFLPWLWREAVALQLTGPGLAEFVKFLAEVRTGEIRPQRLYFLLPLFVAMLALPLCAGNRRLALPGWLRWLLRLAVVPLALAALSPVWTPGILLAPEFRLQTLLAVIAVGLAVVAPWLRSIPLVGLAGLLAVAGLAAVLLSYWQFSLVQSAIGAAYHSPVWLGWGWWLTAAGLGLGIIGGLGAALTSRS